MAIAKQSGSTPFYKTGPLYAHGPNGTHPIDPKKEAKKKAEANASKATKVYGKTTRTSTTDKDGLTTHTISTPYTQSGGGKGSSEFNAAYRAAKAAGETSFPYGDKTIKVEARAKAKKKGVTTRTYKTFDLKPSGIVPVSASPKADVKIKNRPSTPPKSPSVPSYNFSMKKQSGTKIIDKKVGGNKTNLRRPSKSSGGNSCGC